MLNRDAYIVGYYGMRNTGDDALLSASVWGAKHYLKAKNIAATNCEPVYVNNVKLAPTIKDKASFKGQNRLLRYGHALGAKHIIFGGGSVFHNAQDITIKRHLMKLARGHNHRAIGVSLGPFKNKAAEVACRQFLNESAFTGLRDRKSFLIAQDLAPNANIKLTFDLAPLLLCQQPVINKQKRESIGVSLCPRESLTGDATKDYERAKHIAKLLTKIHDQTGQSISFITINGHEQFGDKQIHNWVIGALPNHIPYHCIDYQKDPIQVMNVLAGLSVILSMRLHGSILSYLVDTPVISLNYHEKCEGWCDQIGMPSKYRVSLDDIDINHIAEVATDALHHGFEKSAFDIDDAIHCAKKNWEHSAP